MQTEWKGDGDRSPQLLFSLPPVSPGKAPLSSQDKYVIKKIKKKLLTLNWVWQDISCLLIRNQLGTGGKSYTRENKTNCFHAYHNIGGNHRGIIADRLNEEHLQGKAKLSWRSAITFRTFNQLLFNPASLPPPCCHPFSRAQDQEGFTYCWSIQHWNSPLHWSIFRTTP